MRESGNQPGASLDRFNHQIAHHLPGNTASGGNMADDFTITTVQREGMLADAKLRKVSFMHAQKSLVVASLEGGRDDQDSCSSCGLAALKLSGN